MRSVVLTSFIIGSLRRSSHCMAFSRCGGGGVLVPPNKNVFSVNNCNFAALNTKRSMSFDANEPPPITQIGKDQLKEIFEDLDNAGREGTGYVVMDVRELDEIEYTGKISTHANTLPLQALAARNAFNMEEEDFEEVFGFPKPSYDETLVFSCKAGIRSMHAAQIAGMAGYTNLVNYSGGSMDWFQ